MPSYLFYFADAHNEFRIPELKSIAELYKFPISLPQNPDDCDPTRPCLVIDLEEEEHAQILANRCILIKHVVLPLIDYYSLILTAILDLYSSFMDKEILTKPFILPIFKTSLSGVVMSRILLFAF